MQKMILGNVADYHATKAVEAYLSGDMDRYCYHIAIADRLWAKAA
jgi:hypothetical protein